MKGLAAISTRNSNAPARALRPAARAVAAAVVLVTSATRTTRAMKGLAAISTGTSNAPARALRPAARAVAAAVVSHWRRRRCVITRRTRVRAMAHAIALTLVRLVITQRRLLQWETTAAATARAAGLSARAGALLVPVEMAASPFIALVVLVALVTRTTAAATARAAGLSARAGALLFLVEMAASPFIALIVLVTIAAARPSSLAVAGPLLALWVAAPLVAYWLSQPVSPERQLLSSEDRRFLRLIARKTWRYFDTFMGAEDHGLPPDNFQEAPTPRLAHRTSPTNIGMGLLSTLAAHDLGFIRTPELVERLEARLSTMDGLERFEGHLLNWYDTRTLAPLPPRYVSTVDSGNLAGTLLALAEGLRQLSGEPQSPTQICAGLADTAEMAGP